MRDKGTIVIEILVAVAILGAAGWWLTGDARRAKRSTAATERLEVANTAVTSSAAAGVTSIGRAANDVPDSPATEFIRREVPAVLSKLPAPDPQALLEAEKRRTAVMEGRAELANQLYEREAKRSAQLQRERDDAIAARRQADLDLQRAAAAEQARTTQLIGAAAIAVLLFGAWVYVKIYSITPATIGVIAADIRRGVAPITAFDTNLAPWMYARVNKASRLATEPIDP